MGGLMHTRRSDGGVDGRSRYIVYTSSRYIISGERKRKRSARCCFKFCFQIEPARTSYVIELRTSKQCERLWMDGAPVQVYIQERLCDSTQTKLRGIVGVQCAHFVVNTGSVCLLEHLLNHHQNPSSSPRCFKLSVKRTGPFYLLGIEDLFNQESQPCRTHGESVGGIFEMDSSD